MDIEARKYDLKAMNPNRQAVEDTRTPEELMDIIETNGEEIRGLLAELSGCIRGLFDRRHRRNLYVSIGAE